MSPVISVITCTYNSIKFLDECVYSLQQQSYKDFEHVIQDGGSQDGTIDYIEELVKKTPYISFEHKLDEGIYSGLNNAIQRCRGEYICLLNSDDKFYDKSVLKRQISKLKENNADIVFGNLVFTDYSGGKITRKWTTKNFRERTDYGTWVPPHTTMLVRRSLLHDIQFDEKYKISADFDWSIKLLKKSGVKIAHNENYVIKMRSGGASTSGFRSELRKLREDFDILRKHDLHWWFLVRKKFGKIPQFLLKASKK